MVTKSKMAHEFLDTSENKSSFLSEIANTESKISFDVSSRNVKVKSIKPNSAFCIKARSRNLEKIFINVCHCSEIPAPEIIDEAELARILESDEPSTYRVPMSIGEAHAESDKNGHDCTCYDVVINSEFFEKVKKSTLFCSFLIGLAYESVQDKYHLDIERDSCKVLKNKNYHGNMPSHYIREKPLIADLGSVAVGSGKSKSEVGKSFKTRSELPKIPQYSLRQNDNCSLLMLDVLLSDTSLPHSISVNIGEDRVLVNESTQNYSLDIFVPHSISQEECTAQFDICKKVLSIDMPIAVI